MVASMLTFPTQALRPFQMSVSASAVWLEMAKVIHIHFHTVLLYPSSANFFVNQAGFLFLLPKKTCSAYRDFFFDPKRQINCSNNALRRGTLSAPLFWGGVWRVSGEYSQGRILRCVSSFSQKSSLHCLSWHYARLHYPHAWVYVNLTWRLCLT